MRRQSGILKGLRPLSGGAGGRAPCRPPCAFPSSSRLERYWLEGSGAPDPGFCESAGEGELGGLGEAVIDPFSAVAVGGEGDAAADFAEVFQEGPARVRFGAIAAGHGTGIDLDEEIALDGAAQGFAGGPEVTGACGVEHAVVLVELADEADVTDDLPGGIHDGAADGLKVIGAHGIDVAGVMEVDEALQLRGGGVD